MKPPSPDCCLASSGAQKSVTSEQPSSWFTIESLAKRFRRTTVSNRFIPVVDGLRFLAIALVVLHHIEWYVSNKITASWATELGGSTLTQAFLRQGYYGVHLFFVISGFVLGLPLAGHYLRGEPKQSYGAYLLRRVTRLEPPFILAVLASFFVLVVLGYGSAGDLVPRLLATLGYSHVAIYGEASKISIVTWSLEVEVQFYLLAPLIGYLLYQGRPLVRRVNLVVIAFAFSILQTQLLGYPRAMFSLLNFPQYFLAGFLLADLYVTDWNKKPAPRRVWDLAGVFGLVMTFVGWNLGVVAARFILPPAYVLLFIGCLRGPALKSLFSTKLLISLGGMCYSIYLVHPFLIALFIGVTKRVPDVGSPFMNFALQSVILSIPVIVCSSIFYLLIEKPCMARDWPQKLMRRLRGVPEVLKTAAPSEGSIVPLEVPPLASEG